MSEKAADFPEILELNVGGVSYTTTLNTLRKEADSLLSQMFSNSGKTPILRDSKGKFFLDRDGVLFRYILDYLRNQKLILPENFHEKDRLKTEAEYFRLPNLVRNLSTISISRSIGQSSNVCCNGLITGKQPGYITVGYRGTFAFGRDGLADVKFRKLARIIVCGKVSLCREVFQDTLNESRDPDRGTEDRYTSRFFLKHTFLEQAFDMLVEQGFSLAGSCGSGTNSAGEIKPGLDTEESKWQHYNEFIFERR